MSEVQAIAGSPVRSAIARAAERTGVDFDYLLAQARLESGLDPTARARTSSAAGLYQFLGGTWLNMLEQHGAENGLGWAAQAIERGRVADPSMRSQIMALRFDPQASALMAAELASDNRDALRPVLGRDPDASELYLAHFLGQAGASQFLNALRDDPGQSAASLFPAAAAANRPIFYGAGGARSVGAVMDVLRGKVATAMNQTTPEPAFAAETETSGASSEPWGMALQEYARWKAGASLPSPEPGSVLAQSGPTRPSMAETLDHAFGLSDRTASAPAYVRQAYDRLKGLGL